MKSMEERPVKPSLRRVDRYDREPPGKAKLIDVSTATAEDLPDLREHITTRVGASRRTQISTIGLPRQIESLPDRGRAPAPTDGRKRASRRTARSSRRGRALR